MSVRRVINVFYIERRYFSADFPEGRPANAVVVDDELFTVPREDLVAEKVEVRSYPLSDLIESKRNSGVYDPDFEERIAMILHEEEMNERKRFDNFRLTQITSSCEGFEECPDGPHNDVSDPDWVSKICEASSLHAFVDAVNRIISYKQKLDYLRANRTMLSPYAWELSVCDQKSKIRKTLSTITSINISPLRPEIKKKLIEEKKKVLQIRQEVFRDFPLNSQSRSELRVETGNPVFSPSPSELELEEFVNVLDFICRRFGSFYLRNNTRRRHTALSQSSTMEVDDPFDSAELTAENPVVDRVSDDTDRLAEAMIPLSLREEIPEPSPETGAIPKRRHH